MRITLDVKYAPISIEMRTVMISGDIENLTQKTPRQNKRNIKQKRIGLHARRKCWVLGAVLRFTEHGLCSMS